MNWYSTEVIKEKKIVVDHLTRAMQKKKEIKKCNFTVISIDVFLAQKKRFIEKIVVSPISKCIFVIVILSFVEFYNNCAKILCHIIQLRFFH